MLASWMGGVDVAAGEEILNRANIPTFPYPDTAARAFNYMWQYTYNLQALYETPAMPEDSADLDARSQAGGRASSPRSRAEGRTILTEFESQAAAGGLRHPGGQDDHRRRRAPMR